MIVQETEDGVQKLLKLFGLFSIFLLIIPFSLQGQSFADFKRTQSGSFQTFKDEKDKQFNTYLQEQWQEYEAYTTPDLYTNPKPKTIEELHEMQTKPIGPNIDIAIIKLGDQNKTSDLLVSVKNEFSFDFFGTYLGFDIDPKMKTARFYPRNQNGILSFFGVMASSDYESIVFKLQSISKKMNLNDWGVYELVAQLSKSIYAKPDEEKLFRWFILNKMSYDTKIALWQNHVVLLQNTLQTVYATPRYKISGIYYYALDHQNTHESLGRLYTYEKNYPQAVKKLDFKLQELPNLNESVSIRKLSFSSAGKTYDFELKLNKNLIDYMGSYPQVDYDVYFNADFDKRVYSDLSRQIREYLNGQKASYGLNFLLHLVQKSFTYERDEDQFGKNKVMFAEETLYHKSSDCEDRAVLFAKLVKKIFNYSVVGVKYADHMSTALYVPIEGDEVKIASRRYVIADPTYVNANIGMNMPKYKHIQPESFIKLQ